MEDPRSVRAVVLATDGFDELLTSPPQALREAGGLEALLNSVAANARTEWDKIFGSRGALSKDLGLF